MRRSSWPRLALVLLAGIGISCGAPDLPTDTQGRDHILYLQHCASCHGASGKGSWRAWLFLVRPGNLADSKQMDTLSDQYLFDLIKHGGSPSGKPGMPSFSFQLTDEEIREIIAYVRTLSRKSE